MLPISSSNSVSLPQNEAHPASAQQMHVQKTNRTIKITQPSPRPKLTLNFDIPPSPCIGRGLAGEVFKDPDNPGYVIKRYNKANSSDAQKECHLFNTYYGEGSAELFTEKEHTCLRMLEVPGVPLTRLSQFPENADKMFLDMIIDMGESKIIHGDLHMGNILFDEQNNRFWPIDFSNSYEHYYSLDKNSKLFVNEMADREFCSILKSLRENAISNI
ncbi:OspG family effector kinase [Escherichia coli]|uniref:OspG family effector kinase n=1 Tax=Escherichia coli TaxID=562 RepID=UPI002019DDAD|nr:RIO1 family regulatory kinase/ATPase [Escherichia coli]